MKSADIPPASLMMKIGVEQSRLARKLRDLSADPEVTQEAYEEERHAIVLAIGELGLVLLNYNKVMAR